MEAGQTLPRPPCRPQVTPEEEGKFAEATASLSTFQFKELGQAEYGVFRMFLQ